ncbi:MAG: NAD(P)H-dependent oxidoreductase subunit E, partial [Chloroflexota bacterium]
MEGRRDRVALRGRRVDPAALAEVRSLLGDRPRRRDLLIEHLHLIQDRYGRISHGHLVALCQELRISLAEGYEVATFYASFDVVPDDAPIAPPAARVCDGLPCRIAGADSVADDLAARGRSVRRVPCLGRCDHAPALAEGTAAAHVPDVDIDRYLAGGGYALLRSCLAGERDPGAVMDELEASGLRGLGGAGFPTARKWRAVRAEPAPRYVVV